MLLLQVDKTPIVTKSARRQVLLRQSGGAETESYKTSKTRKKMSTATPLFTPIDDQPSDRGLSPAEIKHLKFQADTDQLVAAFNKDQLKLSNVDWVVTLFLIGVHVGALFAFMPMFFSWTGVAVCLALHWATCSIGICLGYHRYLAHSTRGICRDGLRMFVGRRLSFDLGSHSSSASSEVRSGRRSAFTDRRQWSVVTYSLVVPKTHYRVFSNPVSSLRS
jgi:hypothetical protein